MDLDEAYDKAHDWLKAHGYRMFADGTWGYAGEEALADQILASYIAEQEALKNG